MVGSLVNFTFAKPYTQGTPVNLALQGQQPPPPASGGIKRAAIIYQWSNISQFTPATAYPTETNGTQFVASHFDFVDLGLDFTGVANIKAAHPDIIVIGYIDFYSIAPWNTDYYNLITTSKESWMLHTTPGGRDPLPSDLVPANRVAYDSSYVMDFSNAEWRAFFINWLQGKIAANPLYDGVFADNVQPVFILDWNPYPMPSGNAYPINFVANWDTYMAQFTQAVKSALGSKIMIINSPEDVSEPIGRFLPYADGECMEHFAHVQNDAYNVFNRNVVSQMQILDTIHTNFPSKVNMVYAGSDYNATDANNYNLMLYCLAGYLLSFNDKDNFSFGMLNYDTKRRQYYPELDVQLGSPTGPRYTVSGTLMARNFANGTVYLNYGTSPVTVGGVTYPARSGKIP